MRFVYWGGQYFSLRAKQVPLEGDQNSGTGKQVITTRLKKIILDNCPKQLPLYLTKQVLRSTILSSTILSFFFDNSRIGRF